MFKALFVGYLFGIRSERQLMREIEVNVAYRGLLDLVSSAEADRSGVRRLDAEPEPAPTLQRRDGGARHLRCDRRAGDCEGAGPWHGAPYRFEAPEGQRQYEPLRQSRHCQIARGLLGGHMPASEGSLPSPANACSLLPPRTSRKWLSPSLPDPRHSLPLTSQNKTPPKIGGVCQRSEAA
jgi:hypothetical protein